VTDPSPGAFIARILGPGGRPAGAGALLAERHVVTCAHVVNTVNGVAFSPTAPCSPPPPPTEPPGSGMSTEMW
jgi:hypothetical protein